MTKTATPSATLSKTWSPRSPPTASKPGGSRRMVRKTTFQITKMICFLGGGNDRVRITHGVKDREGRVSAPPLCSHGNKGPVMTRQEITGPPAAANHSGSGGGACRCSDENRCVQKQMCLPWNTLRSLKLGRNYVMRRVWIWAFIFHLLLQASPSHFSPPHTFCTYTSDAVLPRSGGKLSEVWVMEEATASSADGPETTGSCRWTMAFRWGFRIPSVVLLPFQFGSQSQLQPSGQISTLDICARVIFWG